jgi:hypothetical protein
MILAEGLVEDSKFRRAGWRGSIVPFDQILSCGIKMTQDAGGN